MTKEEKKKRKKKIKTLLTGEIININSESVWLLIAK